VSQLSTAEVEDVVRGAYEAMETMDTDHVRALLADDMQAVDGLMRTWRRGLGEIGAHLGALESSLERWGSDISDMEVRDYGDTAVVTYTVAEKYSFQGTRYEDLAPSSMVLRRIDGNWKIVLFQSVPLPPEK
jgi:ketosteroid isomerase-like protein